MSERQLQDVANRRSRQCKNTDAEPLPLGTGLQELIELSLRDQILELEEKIFFGNLGKLKVNKREDWVAAITNKDYNMDTDSIIWGEGDKLDKDAIGEAENKTVLQLAAAIVQVGQMIPDHDKYLKQPLGEDEKEKKKRLKKEEDARKKKEEAASAAEDDKVDDEDDDDDDDEVKVVMTPYKRWEKSLMSSTTLGQLFLHLTTLDNSIVWSKSILNTKCKVCRRKTDPDKMLICDNCDNGYHMYCLKPKLKTIPEGDWFCPECKPKQRTRSPKKKVRKSFSFHEAESDEEDEETSSKRKSAASNKPKKRIIESEDDGEERKETPPKKKSSGGRRKIIESESDADEESEDEEQTNTKKRGLANLLGKRGAAKKAESKMKGLDNSFKENDEEEDDRKSRRGTRGRTKTQEDKENSNKRGRNLNESFELNVGALEQVVKGENLHLILKIIISIRSSHLPLIQSITNF